ncbi:MAG: ABC transporter ATP-binding protein/permease [Clostridia bacterium]|nr:ABC transporter ATP-binding protein/permease [Clostridia bacterium]
MLDKDLFKLLEDKKDIAAVIIISIFGMLVNVGITACICYVIYLAVEGNGFDKLWPIFLILLGGIIVRMCLSILSGRIKAGLGAKVKKSLRKKTYDKMLKMGLKSVDGMNIAGLTQVSIEGIEQLDLYYSSYLPQFFYSMIAPIILFIISVFIDWRTALVLLACVPIIPISIVAVSKYAKKIFAKYWGKYVSMGDGFLDSVQGLKELKIFSADKYYGEKMNLKSEEFRKITMKVLVMQLASTTIMDLVAYGGAGVGIAVAIWGVSSRGLAPIYALFLILVAVEFFLPLRALGSAFHVAMNGASAGKKISSLLNAPLPEWGDEDVEDTQININGADFSYDGKRKALDGVNMSFSKGMTAIVGESGSGKSTLVSLIAGAIRPSVGNVEIGGKKLSALDRDKYYAKLGVVSYDTYIFNDTVRNNFLLAKKDVSEEEIYTALKKVNLYDFIIENGGIDKVVDEDGSNISGGQKQRLALAVNIVADKQIYVFDEATSNIDTESEKIIMEVVAQLAKKAVVIVISHRLANVVNADRIYYLADGKVTEEGSHSRLCEKNGEYARLYFAQKSLEEGYKKTSEVTV